MESTEIKAPENGPVSQPAPMVIPEVLTQQQALQVLVDAARAAQTRGIFTLDDAELVNKAIKAFMPPPPPSGPVPSQQ